MGTVMKQDLFALFDRGARRHMIIVGCIFDWHDLWFGIYINENNGQPRLYFMIPFVGIYVQWSSRVWRR